MTARRVAWYGAHSGVRWYQEPGLLLWVPPNRYVGEPVPLHIREALS